MSENYQNTTRTPVAAISPEERQRREMQSIADRAYERAKQESKKEISNLQRQHQLETEKLNNQLKNLQGTFSATIKQHEQNLNTMRQQYDSQLNDVRLEVEEKRAQDRRELTEQMNKAVGSLKCNVESLRNTTAKALNKTNTRIDALQKETKNALKNQQQQIDGIVKDFERRNANNEALKSELLKACNSQVSLIELKNHEKYAPTELLGLKERLNGINNLPVQAAIANLNYYFYSLLELSSNIEVRKKEYETMHLFTLDAVNEVLSKVEKNKNELTRINYENKVENIDINFWSDGKYQKLEDKLNEIKRRITFNLDEPSYQKEFVEKDLLEVQRIDEEQSLIVNDAIKRANASDIRKEISKIIKDHVAGNMGIPLLEEGFENKDRRNAYYLKFGNNYSQILVVIDPIDVENNKIIRKTIFYTLNGADQQEINNNIDNILRENNLIVGHGTCIHDNENAEEKWKHLYDYDVVNKEIPVELKRELNLCYGRTKNI